MNTSGAIVFLPREGICPSVFLSDILFDPAALWLSETLRRSGVERFLVVCDNADRDAAARCFPEDTTYVTSQATDAPARLADFLSQVPGGVVVVTRPVLLAGQGASFDLPGRAQEPGVFTIRGAALAAALKDGRDFDEALSALGDASPWAGRVLPLKNDLAYRCATVEPLARSLSVERLVSGGVRVVDADRTYVGPACQVGAGSTLLPGVILRGRTAVGADCTLGPDAVLTDCTLGDRVSVNASQLTASAVADDAVIGPFACVRPDCRVGKGVRLGNFVALKNAVIGDGAKIAHLTYLGDCDVGAAVNIGCGTVTVNYDGERKFRTVIGDGAFIGCNTNLVAPVTVGAGAYTAAGSTITEDVPPESLAIARDRQTGKKNWAKRRRRK